MKQEKANLDESVNRKVKVMGWIEQMYLTRVPKYLIEDHPLEFPETAKELIKHVGQAKGNGAAADQLDLDLTLLFRNNELRQRNKAIKDHQRA